jgi:fused signal recognition particle receptor
MDYRVWEDQDSDGEPAVFVEAWVLSEVAAARLEVVTAQRDKLLTDPVRLQVKELEVKLAAAETARDTAEKRALQHEAEMLAKVEAAQAEADRLAAEEAAAVVQSAKEAAQAKLAALGLTAEEIAALSK